MGHYIFKLRRRDRDSLAAVRNHGLLWAADTADFIWLKSQSAPDVLLRQLPVLETYITDEQDRLFIPGALTPVGVLPVLEWSTLPAFLPVQVPVAAMPARMPGKIPVRLKASAESRPGNALLCDLKIWKQYGETAPSTRLDVLSYAVSESAQVIITGNPLPALPGIEYWSPGHGLFFPCGYEPELPLYSLLLGPKLNPDGLSMVLFHQDGSFDCISKRFLIKSTRSGIRQTTILHD